LLMMASMILALFSLIICLALCLRKFTANYSLFIKGFPIGAIRILVRNILKLDNLEIKKCKVMDEGRLTIHEILAVV